jgi:hypothetical protein
LTRNDGVSGTYFVLFGPNTGNIFGRGCRVRAMAVPSGSNRCFWLMLTIYFPLPSVLVSTAYHGQVDAAIEIDDLPDNVVLSRNCACDNIRGAAGVHKGTRWRTLRNCFR